MINIFYYKTDIGKIGIAESNSHITNVYFGKDQICDQVILNETALLQEAADQISMYLKGELKIFSLPIAPQGTAFMKKVWDALKNVSYGQTASYKDIAISIGNHKAVRAVGMANNRNPLPLLVPCHRIIGSNGELIGYRGGLEIKRYLLELESRVVSSEW